MLGYYAVLVVLFVVFFGGFVYHLVRMIIGSARGETFGD